MLKKLKETTIKKDRELVSLADLAHYRYHTLKQQQVYILRAEGIKLPIFSSEELAELVGLTIGDGNIWLDKRYKVSVPRHVRFFNKDEALLNYYNKLTFEIFGIKTKIKHRFIDHSKTNSLSNKFQDLLFLEYRNTTHAILLTMLGVPAGAKVLQEYEVPEWIKNGNMEIKRGFIRGLWMCDGCIPHLTNSSENYDGFQMNYTLWKSKRLSNSAIKFLTDIKTILEEFDITSSIRHTSSEFVRKDGTVTTEFKLFINRE